MSGEIIDWNPETFEEVRRLTAENQRIVEFVLLSGNRFATISSVIRVIDRTTGATIASVKLPGDAELKSLAVSPDERWLVAGNNEGAVSVWDLNAFVTTQRRPGHASETRRVMPSPDESLVATAGGDGQAILWDVATGEPLQPLSGHRKVWVELVGFHGGAEVMTECDGQLCLWDTKTGSSFRTCVTPMS